MSACASSNAQLLECTALTNPTSAAAAEVEHVSLSSSFRKSLSVKRKTPVRPRDSRVAIMRTCDASLDETSVESILRLSSSLTEDEIQQLLQHRWQAVRKAHDIFWELYPAEPAKYGHLLPYFGTANKRNKRTADAVVHTTTSSSAFGGGTDRATPPKSPSPLPQCRAFTQTSPVATAEDIDLAMQDPDFINSLLAGVQFA